MLWIDNEPLDLFLKRKVPGRDFEGLVPAWLDWMDNQDEQAVVHKRMAVAAGKTTRVPLLICPDDLDFSCSLVVAEVESTEAEVRWNRLGYDVTATRDPEEVGTEVEWFEEINPLKFSRSEYEACVLAFRLENLRTTSAEAARGFCADPQRP